MFGVQEVLGSNPGSPTKFLTELQPVEPSRPTAWAFHNLHNDPRTLYRLALQHAIRPSRGLKRRLPDTRPAR